MMTFSLTRTRINNLVQLNEYERNQGTTVPQQAIMTSNESSI